MLLSTSARKIILLYFLQKATEVRRGWHSRDEHGDKARLGNLYLSICTGKHFLCKQSHARTTQGLQRPCAQCRQLAPAGANVATPKSQATAQHDCMLLLLHPFHTTSRATVTATSPLPGAWPGSGRRRQPSVKHGCNLLHKNPGEERRETPGASLQGAWKRWHCSFHAPQELHWPSSPEMPGC